MFWVNVSNCVEKQKPEYIIIIMANDCLSSITYISKASISMQ